MAKFDVSWTRRKAKKIKKLADQIRIEAAMGHDIKCLCFICESTFLVQRTMVYLEKNLEAGNVSEKIL